LAVVDFGIIYFSKNIVKPVTKTSEITVASFIVIKSLLRRDLSIVSSWVHKKTISENLSDFLYYKHRTGTGIGNMGRTAAYLQMYIYVAGQN
jgi:hypothetical protein